MAELPPELGPAGGPPEAFGQASSDQRFAPRNITMEDAIARQLDRIAFLRSTGQEWSEAVYQLRDMIVGLEDDEFWDGIPEHVRNSKEFRSLTGKALEREKAKWAVEGWNGYPVRAFKQKTPDGTIVPVYMPTSENLSCALRIIMRVLSRAGIVWRTRRVSTLKKWGEEDKEKNGVEVLGPPPDEEEGVEMTSPEIVTDGANDI